MAEESKQYDVRAIRQLLLTAFTAEELNDLFYFSETPELREVPNEFAPGDSLPTMVRKAVRYCESRYLLAELLAEVKEARPRAYEKSGDTLRAKAKPAAPLPGARSRWLVSALAAGAAVIVIAVVVLLVWHPWDGRGPEPTVATQPSETTAPSSEPTLTPLPRGAMREFIVLYDDVAIHAEPTAGSVSVETVQKETRLEVINWPKALSGALWWPVITKQGKQGWVEEWTANVRMIKPLLRYGDTVEVVNPLLTGETSLYGDNPEGGCDIYDSTTLIRGTKLMVRGEPDPYLCPNVDPWWDELSVEFWPVVVGDSLEGQWGWIADFYGPRLREEDREPVLYIAPEWYLDLTE